MRIPLANLFERLRGSQWVLPTLLALGAVVAVGIALKVDQWADAGIQNMPWFVFSGSTEDARQLLATLAGSMVSLTTITFSVTMIVLTLASNQFGPRVLRNFLRDHFNQTVLGTFVAALLYCLLLLGQLPPMNTEAPPRIAVSLAILFTVVCIFALVGFVHHTARSIQTSHVVQEASDQLSGCLQKLFPRPVSEEAESVVEEDEPEFGSESMSVQAVESGYLQAVDLDRIEKWATTHDTVLKVFLQPGEFVTAGDTLVASSPAAENEEAFAEEAREWFFTGPERTGEQDARYGFRQLVEIAVRALSPGTNDPFTALNAIDHIGCGLALVAQREPATPHLFDDGGTLRVITPIESFVAIAQDTFDPLRFYGREHPLVIARLYKILSTLSNHVVRDADRAWVAEARGKLDSLVDELPDKADREPLQTRQG